MEKSFYPASFLLALILMCTTITAQQTVPPTGSKADLYKSQGKSLPTVKRTTPSTTRTPSAVVSPSSAKPVNNTPTNTKPVESKSELTIEQDPTTLPYYMYKGIKDVQQAKEQWAADEEAKQLAAEKAERAETEKAQPKAVTPVKQVTKPTTTSKSFDRYADPNANRRLPKNYDDSKININTK